MKNQCKQLNCRYKIIDNIPNKLSDLWPNNGLDDTIKWFRCFSNTWRRSTLSVVNITDCRKRNIDHIKLVPTGGVRKEPYSLNMSAHASVCWRRPPRDTWCDVICFMLSNATILHYINFQSKKLFSLIQK